MQFLNWYFWYISFISRLLKVSVAMNEQNADVFFKRVFIH